MLLKSIAVFSILFYQFSALAISPQQYCERLHARRPANVNSSFEVLNVDVPSATTSVIPGSPSSPGYPGSQTSVFSITKTIKKCCKNGEFLFSILTNTQHSAGCTHNGSGNYSGCPTPGRTCEGNGCNNTSSFTCSGAWSEEGSCLGSMVNVSSATSMCD